MKNGYTLVELLIAVSIIGIISIISVNLLWDTVTTRSKEYSIERSSDNFRQFIQTLTNSIQESTNVLIPANGEIRITGKPCRTVFFNSTGGYLEGAVDEAVGCVPPASGYQKLTDENILISRFDTTPVSTLPAEVNITVEGVYKDSLGEHPFDYQTTIHPRISI